MDRALVYKAVTGRHRHAPIREADKEMLTNAWQSREINFDTLDHITADQN